LVSTVTGSAISAVAIGRLMLTRVQWLPTYAADATSVFSKGAINDFTTANPLRFHLVSLQVPLYSLLGSVPAANGIAWATVAVLLLVWIRLVIRRERGNQLIQLSALAVIAMLPMYHRFVDAVLIALPVCWAFTSRGQSVSFTRSFALLSAAPFLVPGAAMLNTAAHQHLISTSVITSWCWQVVVLPHQAWAALALALLLLVGMVPEQSGTKRARVSRAIAQSLSPMGT